ncbi:MAG: PIN domain nuclease [Thalassolituus sp.]|jgi:predicted nucleic acid-binding protein|uniref:PilT protein-like protein n=2 Tax=Thalassolituus oleivorans TaxID=187493 RepID=M5DS06_9GAMM|nr:PIN domain nuclease [Thalassolituus oleivorans]PCI46972.1 MAG: PIN domain nuclease [Oceanospirillales bacterium]CCU71937.1 PilT protein-like protein [Thalassolituus oleivorans MIL-1]|tara:strand:- start:240 stop:629 length:390 start_codon:yes stop_codon:yes gene_type:complete
MIVVDSSVWIDYFSGTDNKQTDKLDNVLGLKPVAIGDLILTEVLQGFRHDKDYKAARALFEDVTIFEMLGTDMALKSADNFRALRKKGVTVRKTADVIIASFCIERKLPLLFSDKDFKPFVKHLGLAEA